MRHHRISAILAVALASTAVSSPASAQDARAEQEQQRVLESLVAAQLELERTLVSVNFPGGSLTQYAAALADAMAPEPANIVLRGDTDAVVVGPASLDGVRISAALEIVAGEYQFDSNRYLVLTKEIREREGRPVYSVQVVNPNSTRGGINQQESPRDILVLQIKELTTALPGDPPESVVPAETVLTAIETVLEVAGESRTEVKYHAPSGLVMLAGPIDSLRAAQEVLSQMSRDTSVRRSRARELQSSQGLTNPEMLESDLADAQAKLELAVVKMRVADQRFHLATKQLDEQQQLHEGGFVSDGEMNTLELRIVEAQAEVEESKIEIERHRQRVEQLQRAFERARAIATGGSGADELDALRAENAMLRDRLAMMEAQLAKLQAETNSRNRTGGGAGGGRSGGSR